VRLLFISICKQRVDIIRVFANIDLSTAASLALLINIAETC